MSSKLNQMAIDIINKVSNKHYSDENESELQELFDLIFSGYKDEIIDAVKRAGYEVSNIESTNKVLQE